MSRAKRTFDLICAVAGLSTTLPAWPVIAIAIKRDSPGPVLHRAVRVGKDGQPFVLYKFRTMTVQAASQGPGITFDGDARITRVGARLRAWKLDELPNLINVVKGEMSIVGPRPEDPRYVALYSAEERRVFTVRPGITSPATTTYRHESALLRSAELDVEKVYVEEVLRQKLRLDMEYIDNQSVAGDIRVILQTIGALFRKTPLQPPTAADSASHTRSTSEETMPE